MSYIQAEINSFVNYLINQFTGQTISSPDSSYPGEYIALIGWYLQTIGAPSPAIHSVPPIQWGLNLPQELTSFFTAEVFQRGKYYPKGSILLWQDTAGVLIDIDTDHATVFGQKAEPNGYPCSLRDLDNSLCLYAILPIITEPELDIVIPSPVTYKAPQGALPVPLHSFTEYIKVDMYTYASSAKAKSRVSPNDKQLAKGTYEFDRNDNGMWRIKDTYNWINPSDNSVPIQKTRTNSYTRWPEPRDYIADSRYMREHGEATVFNFASGGKNSVIRLKQPVRIAGTFVEGNILYGVPVTRKDGHDIVHTKYGIMMDYLKLAQIDYQPIESKQEIPTNTPKHLTFADTVTLVKAHGERFIDGILGPKNN